MKRRGSVRGRADAGTGSGPGVERVITMLREVVRVDQDVVQIHDYRDINHIGEDIIHEPLESGQGIHEPFGHH